MSSNSTGDLARVERELLARWPESRLEPSLTRINALVDLLGSPHRAMPVVQVAGTNGKTTTARMIDELLRGFGLRVVVDYDMDKKQDVVSVDCLYGVKTIDPNRAVLIKGADR